MTSKAERLRKRKAGQKQALAEYRAAIAKEEARAQERRSVPAPEEPVLERTRQRDWNDGGPTQKQDAAWRWFCRLRQYLKSADTTRASAAREQLKLVERELERDEYLTLVEIMRSPDRIAFRTGRLRGRSWELYLSALRKLVIYRHMNDLGDEE